jgi:hypothetical protein
MLWAGLEIKKKCILSFYRWPIYNPAPIRMNREASDA